MLSPKLTTRHVICLLGAIMAILLVLAILNIRVHPLRSMRDHRDGPDGSDESDGSDPGAAVTLAPTGPGTAYNQSSGMKTLRLLVAGRLA